MASSDNNDDDQNTIEGNPEIVQEQQWEYSLNLDKSESSAISSL